MIKTTLLFGFLALTSIITLSAQVFEPVKWETSIESDGKDHTLVFSATISDGWYVYSSKIDEGGPFPLTLEFDTEEGYELIGDLEEIGKAKTEQDALFDMELIKFNNQLVVKQKLKASADLKQIEGYLTFMTCNNERCLPPTDIDFAFEL